MREVLGYAFIAGLFAFAMLMVVGAVDGQYDDPPGAIEWLSGLAGRG